MAAPPRGHATRARTALLTLYAHPFELAVATILGVSAVDSGLNPASLGDLLPGYLVAVWVLANGLGILGVVVGLFGSADLTGGNPRRTAGYRALEKAGLYLVASGTAVVAVGLGTALRATPGQLWQPVAQLVAIAAACILRAGAIRKAERIELEAVRRLSASDALGQLLRDQDTAGNPNEEGDGHA